MLLFSVFVRHPSLILNARLRRSPVDYCYKQVMRVLHLELEITENVTEVNNLFCISGCWSWPLSGQVLWCSQKLWWEVALGQPTAPQSCVVVVPKPQEKISWQGVVCWCNLSLCLVFHGEHTPVCPSGRSTVAGQAPLLAVLLTNLIQ